MGVHNEIGVIQPLKKIGDICKKNGVFFHTDCAQAIGKIKINVNEMNIDLLSISGHKIYAPKGVGALYVRRKPKSNFSHDEWWRARERNESGTLSPALCVGLGEAYKICADEIDEESKR